MAKAENMNTLIRRAAGRLPEPEPEPEADPAEAELRQQKLEELSKWHVERHLPEPGPAYPGSADAGAGHGQQRRRPTSMNDLFRALYRNLRGY